ncbi:MAG: DNA alkylation repair protein [Pseudomonadota bacterium]
MPEPFKNFFNLDVIEGMARHFRRAWLDFDQGGFVAAASADLAALELKERSAQITAAMATHLPDDFERAGAIMLASLAPAHDGDIGGAVVGADGIAGWAVMPMTAYVGDHGLGHFDLSMTLLKEMTKRFSSEFGIRFFLLDDPDRTLAKLMQWTADPDRHVRRLCSEGTRPRLPWAMQLPHFIKDPAPLLPILEALKDDPSEYVRRSVANNLNDIAKDHPDLVAGIAARWLKGASRGRQQLVRHACRTLIKQGHRPTLKALGYGRPKVTVADLTIETPQVTFGDALAFTLVLDSTRDQPQPLIIDYAIHHRKANGGTTGKVFKWKAVTLEPRERHRAGRRHAIRKITTRQYYPGTHRLEILINGVSVASDEFELIM